MKKLAIIGASYLQVPLIKKAKEMGLETHVFAWAVGDIGETLGHYFYPISIVEKEEILQKCIEIGIDGICSIASDLAVVTVNYVASKMGLIGNGEDNTILSTNKHNMREAFFRNGDPSPRSMLVNSVEDINEELSFPVIVKPLDRSGSRGIYKIYQENELKDAIMNAEACGFIKQALIEEYAEGTEYSVECVSYRGKHHFLAMTLKYTTGSPRFVETGHLEPAPVSEELIEQVKQVVFHALDSLKVSYGASHSEVKIDELGNINIIEIGSRMGGDFIGSSLVYHSTGVDFVKAVIDVALGKEPDLASKFPGKNVGVHFICSGGDLSDYNRVMLEHPEYILEKDIPEKCNNSIVDSSSRPGYFIIQADDRDEVIKYMPHN